MSNWSVHCKKQNSVCLPTFTAYKSSTLVTDDNLRSPFHSRFQVAEDPSEMPKRRRLLAPPSLCPSGTGRAPAHQSCMQYHTAYKPHYTEMRAPVNPVVVFAAYSLLASLKRVPTRLRCREGSWWVFSAQTRRQGRMLDLTIFAIKNYAQPS